MTQEDAAANDATSTNGVEEKAKADGTPKADQAAGVVGDKAQIHSLQERYKGGSAETVADSEYKPLEFDPNSAYALVVTRKYDTHGKLEKTLLKINSQHLLQAFQDVIEAHPTVPEGFEGPVEIEAPFAMLYHNWDALHEHRQTLTEETELAHLDLLLEFMRLEMGKNRTEIIRTKDNGSVKFADLWAIYRPNEVRPAALDLRH